MKVEEEGPERECPPKQEQGIKQRNEKRGVCWGGVGGRKGSDLDFFFL